MVTPFSTATDTVRSLFDTDVSTALGLTTVYPNVSATPTVGGGLWLEPWFVYQSHETVGFAGDQGEHRRLAGELRVSIRDTVGRGMKETLTTADAIVDAFPAGQVSDITYFDPPRVEQVGHENGDLGSFWRTDVFIPWAHDYTHHMAKRSRVATTATTRSSVANAMRDRWRLKLESEATVPTRWDNDGRAAPTLSPLWAYVSTSFGGAENVTVGPTPKRRTVGLLQAVLLAKKNVGMDRTLDVCDIAATEFAGSTVSGVEFDAPQLTVIGMQAGFFQSTLSIPFRFEER
ncbi:MAG: hypothetical protein ACPGVG_08805 [Mycobacterium sp.]